MVNFFLGFSIDNANIQKLQKRVWKQVCMIYSCLSLQPLIIQIYYKSYLLHHWFKKTEKTPKQLNTLHLNLYLNNSKIYVRYSDEITGSHIFFVPLKDKLLFFCICKFSSKWSSNIVIKETKLTHVENKIFRDYMYSVHKYLVICSF